MLELRSLARPVEIDVREDVDERGPLIHATLAGRAGPRPEVALRVGAFGHSMPLAWESVFEGPRGPFATAGLGRGDQPPPLEV
jgi:hypothetical protein